MKTLRLLGKVVGLFGIAAIFSSCHKDKECECTSRAFVDGVEDTDYTYKRVVTVKQKCWELNYRSVNSYTYGGKTTETERTNECEKK